MSTLTRRGFLESLTAIMVGAVAAGKMNPPKPRPQLTFNRSTRYVQSYDVLTDQMINRVDVLYGVANLRPNLSCRVASA